MRRPSLDAVRGFERPVYVVALGGYLADQYGRKPVMVASMALSTGTLAAYAFVPDLAALAGVAPAWAFVAVAAAAGLTAGLYTPAGQALTADLTEGEGRDQAFALLKVANNVGFGSGFVVGGLFFDAGAADLLWPTLALACAGLALGLLALERQVSPAENGTAVAD